MIQKALSDAPRATMQVANRWALGGMRFQPKSMR